MLSPQPQTLEETLRVYSNAEISPRFLCGLYSLRKKKKKKKEWNLSSSWRVLYAGTINCPVKKAKSGFIMALMDYTTTTTTTKYLKKKNLIRHRR